MKVGFIGVGKMGLPMALNLVKSGYDVEAFDVTRDALLLAEAGGAKIRESAVEVARESNIVITMLPAGEQVLKVYQGGDGILSVASEGSVLIDCSTIDVRTARIVSDEAEGRGLEMLDAPVSGGVTGAQAGTLTFMVGGKSEVLEGVRPLLEVMGRNIIHAGGSGNGQAAKVCNNMLLGISMIGISESFTLGARLGLDSKILFDIISSATGDCWALRNHLPVPGIVDTSAANRDFAAGFAVNMMAKDLRLADDAAQSVDLTTTLGKKAAAMYTRFEERGNGGFDYSAIIKSIGE